MTQPDPPVTGNSPEPAATFTHEGLAKSERGQTFYCLWHSGMPAARAWEQAFGPGSFDALAAAVWHGIRAQAQAGSTTSEHPPVPSSPNQEEQNP